MKKQYSYDLAFTDNYKVTTYVDGNVEDYEIVPIYELSYYLERLEQKGYERCYSDAMYVEVQSELTRLTALMQNIERNRLYHPE